MRSTALYASTIALLLLCLQTASPPADAGQICTAKGSDGTTIFSDRPIGKGPCKSKRKDTQSEAAPEPEPEPEPAPAPAPASALAFPGAEGFGAMARGGRGGEVFVVTNLDDDGPGSLRWAIEQSEPRTIVFAVSGIIPLRSEITIDAPFVTIAGQTSPSGITLSGGRLKVRTHDVVIRGLRVRPGADPGGMSPENRDGISIGSETQPVHDVIIDSSSFTWAVDENGSNWYPNERVTVQWCIFAEGLRDSIHPEGAHSMGYLVGPNSSQVTLHHNLFAHNEHRNPVVAGVSAIEVINNVGYNWRSEGLAVSSEGSTTLHAIGNAYIHGGDSTDRPAFYLRTSSTGQHTIYLSENTDSRYRPSAVAGDEWAVAHGYSSGMRATAPVFESSGVVTDPVSNVVATVLARVGSMTPARDPTDVRIVDSVLARTGGVIDSPADVGGYMLFAPQPPPADADADGMPDTWESAAGLNPNDPADRNADRDGDGYTELEEYLASLMP